MALTISEKEHLHSKRQCSQMEENTEFIYACQAFGLSQEWEGEEHILK